MLGDSEENFQKLRLEADGSEGQIKYHLQTHYKHHYNQFFGMDEDGFQRAAGTKSENIIYRWLRSGEKGKDKPRPLEQLQYVHVDQMTRKERQRIHQHWLQKIMEDLDPKANQFFLCQQNGKKGVGQNSSRARPTLPSYSPRYWFNNVGISTEPQYATSSPI